jgi:hypothetical protein
MMTPQDAQRILKVVEDSPGNPEDGSDLIPLKRRFSEEIVFGGHNRVQWRAYQAASGNPNVNTCTTESSAFMKDPSVRKYIRALDRQRIEALVDGEVTWGEAARVAKQLIHANNIGAIVLTGTQLASCIYTVNRHEGLPTATLDLNVASAERIAGATKMFTWRMAEEQRKKVG